MKISNVWMLNCPKITRKEYNTINLNLKINNLKDVLDLAKCEHLDITYISS